MSVLLPFVIAGLVSGAVYGLAAVGLVLTYKSSGVFNFAHGALATVSAYGFYTLNVKNDVPWPVAAALCVFVLGPVMGLILEVLARSVARHTLELKIAATVGVLLAIEAAVTLIYGSSRTRSVPAFLPEGSVDIGGTNVQWSDIATFAVATGATIILSIAFRVTCGR